MSMHLHHPSLSLNGKKKGKVKFKNAEAKQKYLEQEASWKALKNKWGTEAEDKRRNRALAAEPLTYQLSTPIGRTNTNHIPSRDTGHTGAISSKQTPAYTGTNMIGITILHKSCLQPVFNQQEAVDAANMRR